METDRGQQSPEGFGVLVIAAKLLIPRVPEQLVDRPGLWAQLDRGIEGSITCVTAPAGSGKTVLLVSWLRHLPPSFAQAWVSLDSGDGEPLRLWAHVLASLVKAGALEPERIAAFEQGPRELDAVAVARLLNLLLELAGPTVLVLDDVSEVSTDPVLAMLVRRPPPLLRLVLAGRVIPDLPLHQQKMLGQVTELDARDLSFDADEASQLLALSGLRLSQEHLDALMRRTEGWAAGLRLHALAVARNPAGTTHWLGTEGLPGERDLDRFVQREVLERISLEQRDLLVRTSFLDRVCGSLADRLTGRSGSAADLDALSRSGFLVQALGDSATWFRYHQLLGDVLRRSLKAEHGDEIADLHRRASVWFQEEGLFLDAVRHAVSARDWDQLSRLVTRDAWRLIMTNEDQIFDRLLSEMPPDLDIDGPYYPFALAIRAIEARQVSRYERYASTARSRIGSVPEEEQETLLNMLRLFDIIAARWGGNARRLRRASEASLANLADTSSSSLRPAALALAHGSRGTAMVLEGRLHDCDASFSACLIQSGSSGADRPVQNALAYGALAAALRGDGAATDLAVRQARSFADARGWSALMQFTMALVAAGIMHYERGEFGACHSALAEAEESYLHGSEPGALVLLRVTNARLLAAEGRIELGFAALDGLDSVATRVSPFIAGLVVCAAAELQLLCADPDGAIRMMESRRTPPEALGALRARAHWLMGRPQRALKAAQDVVRLTPTTRRWTADAHLTVALAHASYGDLGAATVSLRSAAQIVVAAECPRVYAERRMEFVSLLGQIGDPTFATHLPAELRDDRGERPVTTDGVTLTARERAVLHYLPTMLTAEQIADRMSVSPNTVRSQIRQVYLKLGVHKRLEAVERAHALGMLD